MNIWNVEDAYAKWDDAEQCSECSLYFSQSDMIRVSAFEKDDKYHGDYCCKDCAKKVWLGIYEQLKEQELI